MEFVPDYVTLAIEDGQLEEYDQFLDDDSDSPTYGEFVVLYRSTWL